MTENNEPILNGDENNNEENETSKGFVYPCEFPIRIIGENSEAFEKDVYDILAKNGVDVNPAQLSIRSSSNGTYSSVAYTFTAESREQLDNIYCDLSANKRVKWVI